MQKNYSDFQVPTFARREVYNFDATSDSFEIFRELNQISEEIEECRKRNS